MKIALTGGGTGGHFYPIIAVAEALYDLAEEERIVSLELLFLSDSPYRRDLIENERLVFKKVYAGKARRYFSLLNFFDLFKTFFGVLRALWLIYSEMPDVVFSKGGYAAFPVVLAARIFRIPVFVHESDAIPGRVNNWSGKFAERIAISFEEAAKYFPKEKTALTGVPVRKDILGFTPEEGREAFGIERDVPVILILGGSQGSQKINDVILESLEMLTNNYQIIHQCGKNNLREVRGRANIILEKSLFKNRYHLYDDLNETLLRNAASVTDVVISRAGASAIYEIAAWKLPAILIPLKNSAQDHQRENAYGYSGTGAANVIEEDNLSSHILISEIKRILSGQEEREKMKEGAKKFAKPEAARKIAQEIINLSFKHS